MPLGAIFVYFLPGLQMKGDWRKGSMRGLIFIFLSSPFSLLVHPVSLQLQYEPGKMQTMKKAFLGVKN